MEQKIDLKIFISLLIVLFQFSTKSYSQCAECGSPRTYTSSITLVNDRTNQGLDESRWTGTGDFLEGQIAKFTGANVAYTWEASDFNLGGIILQNGADLTLDRPNQGNEPGFTITNGCIVVGAGSVLDLIYITELENVTICVEDGGEIRFDSRDDTRNIFTLEQVTINLQGPNSKLELGEAVLNIGTGGVVVTGWSGDQSELCENTNPPIPGTSGNISWTDEIQLGELCKILSARILPVEYAYFTAEFNSQLRIAELQWATTKEWENQGFEIERSINGVKNWEKIGNVVGVGYSDGPKEYVFIDQKLPIGGGNIFYRLKQIDFDGTANYTEIRGITVNPSRGESAWVLYPNPSKNNESIQLQLRDKDSLNDSPLLVRIYNSQGTGTEFLVYSTMEVEKTVSDYLRNAGEGLFLLDIFWNNENQQIRIIRK
ncbi:hypothetical protein [Algoriphagus limi]|uniref:Por secretion system C-terminal sorting domain-containing protein n=1 Tax=Algoriphagus limi TaxID=2975273 RepID=A0ABT2G7J0_9BACT|nr:hypothetical protein [Algoriphagus limi]MCS5491237.1 hypothetical protein [Algoriphagus limi]